MIEWDEMLETATERRERKKKMREDGSLAVRAKPTTTQLSTLEEAWSVGEGGGWEDGEDGGWMGRRKG